MIFKKNNEIPQLGQYLVKSLYLIPRLSKIIKSATVLLFLNFSIGDNVEQFYYNIVKSNIIYDDNISNLIENMRSNYSDIDQSINVTEWSKLIKNAMQVNSLPETKENTAIVLSLLYSSSGFRSTPRAIDFLPTPSEGVLHTLGMRPRTCGPLETNIKFVQEKFNISYDEAILLLKDNKTSLVLGIEFLKKNIDQYDDIKDVRLRLQCIFADYNAGIGMSRRATMQSALSVILGYSVKNDGVFGSKTIEAIGDFYQKKGIIKTEVTIKSEIDLLFSMKDFNNSSLVQDIYKEYETKMGFPIVITPTNTPVLGFPGFTKELLTGISNSLEYSLERLEEYDNIISY